MKTILVGIYEGDYGYGSWRACTALFESPFNDPKELKETLKRLALEYLRKEHANGWDMPYHYNFGDILETCDDPEFAKTLAEHGISYLPFDQDIEVDAFEHDDVWIYEDEVNNS